MARRAPVVAIVVDRDVPVLMKQTEPALVRHLPSGRSRRQPAQVRQDAERVLKPVNRISGDVSTPFGALPLAIGEGEGVGRQITQRAGQFQPIG